jgi:hypothetical protein
VDRHAVAAAAIFTKSGTGPRPALGRGNDLSISLWKVIGAQTFHPHAQRAASIFAEAMKMYSPVVVIICIWLGITGTLAVALGGAVLWRHLQRRAKQRNSESPLASTANNSLPTS